MAYQIYRIGEWEWIGGVDGYSTCRAYLQPDLYETQAYAIKKAALLGVNVESSRKSTLRSVDGRADVSVTEALRSFVSRPQRSPG
jgi:hypothetical protein